MSKKMMLLALSVAVAALFALPAVASATPAHISATENFTVTSTTPTFLEDKNGSKVVCSKGVTGNGTFENTTTGSINLTFHGCRSVEPNVACGTEETIVTTTLPFHLISLAANSPGVLITPNAGHFATFNCTIFVKKEVKGNGILGTITAPKCNVVPPEESTTATLKFQQNPAKTGSQLHETYTGVTYQLTSNGVNAAQDGEGQIHFNNAKSLTCT